MRISDWSSDVCSSDLGVDVEQARDIRGAADRGQLQILGVEIIAGQVEADAVVEERGLDPRFIRHRFRLEEHTSELQSLMRISYALFCLNNNHSILYSVIYT